MKRKINFLTSYKAKKLSATSAAHTIFAFITLVIIGLSITVSLWLKYEVDYITRKISDIKSYISSDEADEGLAEVSLCDDLILLYQELVDEYTADQASVLQFIPVERRKILEAIRIGFPDIVVSGIEFSIDKGSLTLKCVTRDHSMPKNYVKNLRDSGQFDYVGYTGYSVEGNMEKDVFFSVDIFF